MQDSDSHTAPHEPLTFFVAERLISKVSKVQDRLILALTLETGCSTDDLLFLNYDDFDFSKKTVLITGRHAKLSPQLCESLQHFGTPGRLYFFSTKQRPQLNPRAVQRVFNKFSEQAGMKATCNTFRKLFLEVSA